MIKKSVLSFIIFFIPLFSSLSAESYRVLDLGTTDTDRFARMNKKGNTVAILKNKLYEYKSEAWILKNELTHVNVVKSEYDEGIKIIGFNDKGDVLITKMITLLDLEKMFLVTADGQVIDLTEKLAKYKLVDRYIYNFELTENGSIIGHGYDDIVLYSPKNDTLEQIWNGNWDAFVENNKDQILFKTYKDDIEDYQLYTPGKGLKNLKDFGLEAYLSSFEDFEGPVRIFDCSINDKGEIAGTCAFRLSLPELGLYMEHLAFIFNYSPDGQLYLASLDKYNQKDGEFLKSFEYGNHLYFSQRNPILTDKWTVSTIDDELTGVWPIFKLDRSKNLKIFQIPKEFKKDQLRPSVIAKRIDSYDRVFVLGKKEGEEDLGPRFDWKSLYIWDEANGVRYLNDLIPAEWRSKIKAIWRGGGNVQIAPNGDILFTAVDLKGEEWDHVLYFVHKK